MISFKSIIIINTPVNKVMISNNKSQYPLLVMLTKDEKAVYSCSFAIKLANKRPDFMAAFIGIH
jgi:hypothetical protein